MDADGRVVTITNPEYALKLTPAEALMLNALLSSGFNWSRVNSITEGIEEENVVDICESLRRISLNGHDLDEGRVFSRMNEEIRRFSGRA